MAGLAHNHWLSQTGVGFGGGAGVEVFPFVYFEVDEFFTPVGLMFEIGLDNMRHYNVWETGLGITFNSAIHYYF